MLHVWLIMKDSLSLSLKRIQLKTSLSIVYSPKKQKCHFHLLIKHVFFSPLSKEVALATSHH